MTTEAQADGQEYAPFRFSIVHLLYLTTLLAAAIALFDSYTLMLDHPDKMEFKDLEFIYPQPQTAVMYSGYFLLGLNILLAVLPCIWARLQPFSEDRASSRPI